MFFKDIHLLDPLLSIIITSYVLYNVINNLIKILKVFLQRVPEDISLEDIEDKIRQVNSVIDVHHTHVWSMDGEHNFLSTHVVIPDNSTRNEQEKIKEEIQDLLLDNNIHHITVEIDFTNENCNGEECEF